MSTGHGGQVLLSGMTYGQVRDHPGLVDEEARLLDLGEHPLKDLTHPEHIYQLSVPDLLSRFPALRTHETPDEDERYRIKDSAVSIALTRASTTLGTPHYIAPEQAEGQHASPQSDLYTPWGSSSTKC